MAGRHMHPVCAACCYRTMKNRVVFFTDLDNTLIYSYKQELGADRIGVEIYQDRTISYMTPATVRMLEEIREHLLVVPVTTRTREQYERIDLGFVPEYALVCNGGILLEKGVEVRSWREDSLKLTEGSRDALSRGRECLESDESRCFPVRSVGGLFLFTKSRRPGESAERVRQTLCSDRAEVFQNGQKLYVVPREINKGMACKRLKKRLKVSGVFPCRTIAAGDSAFDVPMLEEADFSIFPDGLYQVSEEGSGAVWKGGKGTFSEFMLEQARLFMGSIEPYPVRDTML